MKGGKKILRMINKKAQSQIITTVLIILLVLAAIVIVWQVVNTTVRSGAEEAASQASCFGLNLVILKAENSTSNVIVRRDTGASSEEVKDLILFVNGENKGNLSISLSELESANSTAVAFNLGDKIQVAAELESGALCPLSSEYTATD